MTCEDFFLILCAGVIIVLETQHECIMLLFLSAENTFRQLWMGFLRALDRRDWTKDQENHVSSAYLQSLRHFCKYCTLKLKAQKKKLLTEMFPKDNKKMKLNILIKPQPFTSCSCSPAWFGLEQNLSF